MKLLVKRTSTGLVPVGDVSYEEAKKLKMGESYEVTVKRPRNLRFHRKYFALINTAWDYQTEEIKAQCFSNSSKAFRDTILLNTGFCDRIYSYKYNAYVDIPRSVAFGSMSEDEFEQVYSKTLDFIIQHLMPKNVTQEEFNANVDELLRTF